MDVLDEEATTGGFICLTNLWNVRSTTFIFIRIRVAFTEVIYVKSRIVEAKSE
jgi:hypothetical protein